MSNVWSRLINLAGNITGILGPANGGTGIANNAASTLAISGNFDTTVTVTGSTAVTLPTTGTLLANSRTISTTAPITGGGDLSTNRTIAISAASSSAAGSVSYEDSGSISVTVTGALSTTWTLFYSRVAKSVTLSWASLLGSAAAANSINFAAGQVPAALAPLRTLDLLVFVQDNGSNLSTPGYLQVLANGSGSINKSLSSGSFTNASTCGILSGSVTYTIN